MQKEFKIIDTLKEQHFSKIQIEEISNYLETLDYDLENTRYIGCSFAKNERLAKYFFLRDQLKIDTLDGNSYINEILDQCIDWSEFWRLLVISKGFCCIRLSGDLVGKARFAFLSGPNILSGTCSDLSNSIYEDIDY